ncbi:MAG: DNA/RNA non-specific endonuclease, partial [Solobacterium sp.]|nr:DNA/RNA non-specific endonuclease [Solobacterium sp.]
MRIAADLRLYAVYAASAFVLLGLLYVFSAASSKKPEKKKTVLKRLPLLLFAVVLWISLLYLPVYSPQPEPGVFSLDDIAEWTDSPSVSVNDNRPFFTAEELKAEPYVSFSDLDSLGRCGAAMAMVDKANMPKEERGEIESVRPSGYHNAYYPDVIEDGFLYNRCHLIGFQLCGENANEKNLITGTRYMNVEGMLPFENSVQMYVEGTGNHVLYRVRPYYNGDDLLATGVLMEAKSLEDPLVQFCAFCYNVQPGIEIDYATGFSKASETTDSEEVLAIVSDPETGGSESVTRSVEDETTMDEDEEEDSEEEPEEITYVMNTNTKKFHKPYC